MAVYPTSPPPQVGYEWAPEWSTTVAGPFDAGVENMRPNRRRQLFRISLDYAIKDWDTLRVVVDFFNSMSGRAGSFTFKDFNGKRNWTKLFVGQGNGALTVFDLPLMSTEATTPAPIYYVAGAVTGGTLGVGTGADGRDRVTFAAPPADGDIITVTALGILTIYARFGADRLPVKTVRNDASIAYIQTGGIAIVERA